MNSFWLKIVILGVICVGLVVLVKQVKPKLQPETKNFYDVVAKRDEKLRAKPQPIEEPQPEPQAQQPVTQEPTPAVEQVVPEVPTEQQAPPFKPLSEIDELEAERLFNQAMQFRHIGSLPMTSYKTMVDACREIIQRFPGSEYAWKAKRMLADIPEQYRERFKITPEEIDLGNYK